MENLETRDSIIQYGKHVEEQEKANIFLYLASKTISLLGSNIYTFALSLYILRVTGSGTSFAINVFIGMLPRIILGPFAGILADRVNRKRLTVALDICSGLIVFGLLGLASIYGLRIIFIYVAGFLLSTINVFYDTSLTSSLPNLVRDEKLLKINSYSSVSLALAGILSPILAGIVYGLVPIKLFLILNGVSFILSSVLEVFMNFNFNKICMVSSKAAMTFSVLRLEIIEVFSFIKEQKVMCSLLKYILIINFFLSASISVVYPYIINNVLKMSSSQYGAFQAFYFLGMIVCSIVIGNRKEKEMEIKTLTRWLVVIGVILLLTGIPTIGLGLFKIGMILTAYNLVLLFTLGVAIIALDTPILVAMQRLTPEKLRGRLTGVIGTLTGGIAPLGIIVAGMLIDKIHPFIILLVSGLCIIITAIGMGRNKETRVF